MIAAIGTDLARPFVYAACERYGLSYDPDSGGGVLWWGGLGDRSLRAVSGWLLDDESTDVILYGPFGDGSFNEDRWLNEMLLAMRMPRVRFTIMQASPSLLIRRQSALLERFGECRAYTYNRRIAV